MGMSMTWRFAEIENETRVMLEGDISEESDFRGLVSSASSPLVLDLRSVVQINSCGVREWINFVRQLEKQGCNLTFANCPPPIVRQLNMISNFKGPGVIRSVLAPYYCDDCNRDEMKPISIGVESMNFEIVETIPCPECGEDMEFDDMPDSYLEFMNH